MVLLSLGPEAVSALLWHGPAPRFAGPDLAWLLFAPELAITAPERDETIGDLRYRVFENDLQINKLTG